MEEATATVPTNILDEIKPKQLFKGKIIKTTLAGAIVDIGLPVPGIVHISQLQKEPVKRVEDVVQQGQEVDMWVKKVYPKKQRIDLTMIKPLDLEWREIEKEMIVKGTVTRIEKFGAFVEIGAERPGLVHISELTHDYIKNVTDVVKEGDEVEVKILDVDRKKKQIKLSMKALVEKPEKIVKEVVQQKFERRDKETKDAREAVAAEEHEEPIPTAMEMALREAMDKVKDSDAEQPMRKKTKANQNELENILERTLKHKVSK
jgi:ribosomal protein S1